MGWVNYPDFRLGMLDRGTRLQPEIALRSAASASDVLLDTRGAVVRRPGLEDQGVEFDSAFVTVPYFSEDETYLLLITYGNHVLELGDSAKADGGTGGLNHNGTLNQVWAVGSAAPIAGHTRFGGRIYLYRVDQLSAENNELHPVTGTPTGFGYVTEQRWATTNGDYLYGPNHSIRRGQGAVTLGIAVPDLAHYLHPWTRAQCEGIQYVQYDSRLYLFAKGFPTIEVQRSDQSFPDIAAPYTSNIAPHAAPYPESPGSSNTEAAQDAILQQPGGSAWGFSVDALDPEVARRASPPINLLLTSATEMVASDDFFTPEMEGGFITYGSAQWNAYNADEPGDWVLGGVLLRIWNVHSPRVAEVRGIEVPSPTLDDLVPQAYQTGGDIYDFKHPGTSQALVAGDVSTLTSNMLGDWAGPWVKVKGWVRATVSPLTGVNAVPPSLTTGVAGSPHHGWDEVAGYNSTERGTAGLSYSNGQGYYYCDTTSAVGGQLRDHLGLNEEDVGSLVLVKSTTPTYHVYVLHSVTNTSGEYVFTGPLRYHLQRWGSFTSSWARNNEGNSSDITYSSTIEFALFKAKPPHIVMGCTGWNSDPTTTAGQTYKATVHVNDPQFLPANLHTANRPVKRGGVKRGFSTGSDGLPTTTVGAGLEAPLMAGSSIFFRNGVFRPTARVSPVAYEGYWESPPSTASPQGFVSFGAGGSTGFASCGAAHQGRLVVGGFGGSFEDAVAFSRTGQPTALMAPNIDSADDPFSIQLGQSMEEQVQWFGSSQVGLLVGGRTSEYLIRGEPVTALKIGFHRVSSVGGAPIRAAQTDQEAVFVCRDKRALGGIQLKEGADATTFSQRLSDRSASLFTQDILQSGFIYSPYPVFFFLMANGTVLAFTRDQTVGGFTQFSHAHGQIMSMSSAVRSAKTTDSLFFCVKVPKNSDATTSTDKYRLERFNFNTLFDSQRCTGQYTYTVGGVPNTPSVTATTVRFLDLWAYQTLHVVTEDAAGNQIYRGTFTVEPEAVGTTTTHKIDLTGLGLTVAPTKVITGFNFDGVFEPSSVTEVPGYICSYTSGILLGENVSGLTGPKGAVVPVNVNVAPESVSGWVNVYNLGHFSRDAGPSFSLKGPFNTTIQSLSVQVESKE